MMSELLLLRKAGLILSAATMALSMPSMAFAQDSDEEDATDGEAVEQGEIIVTATRRSEALSDIPLAVSAVTAETLQNSGASDIRQLNQLSPSLLVSSTSSEAGGGGARVRGVGTVGDNPGLESSVATFIDGVYRNRAGVGLTELGAIDRIEVLRGPQGTLFGRNASAGLISIITAKPKFEFGGTAEATYGNRGTLRFVGGVTGPLSETIAARFDGVYSKRDGFIKDAISGRKLNNRDRYLVRGQLLFQPNDELSFRVIGDYAKRNEECCAASYLPIANRSRDAAGNIVTGPNPLTNAMIGLGAVINDDTFSRVTSVTPGFGYRSDVTDWGISGELNYEMGGANLTSITSYRKWDVERGQDADFNNLDILHRADDGNYDQGFKTFTQELRLQGEAFEGRLDWLVGGYYANEILTLNDNFQYGADYERFANCATAASVAAGVNVASLVSATGPGCLNTPVANAVSLNPAVPTATAGALRLLAGLTIPGLSGYRAIAAAIGQPAATLNGTALDDSYRQKSRNYAFFTHNVFDIIEDKLSVTLGLRYTNEKKTLSATLVDNNTYCAAIRASALAGLAGLPCVISRLPGGSFTQSGAKKAEDEFTGTAVLSFKPVDSVLGYLSYSRGYKAGGFNLDRASLVASAPNLQQLTFGAEKVKAYEAGIKWNGPGIDINVAAFKQDFSGFQLNAFNGLNFVVTNINSCGTDLANADEDNSGATGACPAASGLKPGVVSKGLELEAFMRPAPNFGINMGLTYTDTSYQDDIVAAGGAPLGAASYQLPNRRLSNSSAYVATGSLSWTPPIGDSGLSGLFYGDFRYQSDTNTGSDLDVEKVQDGFIVFNGRIGIRGPENKWGIELWGQNLFNWNVLQVAFDAPAQGSGTIRSLQRGFITNSNQVYAGFLGEPRTFGITVRGKF
jgi:iron complex outermembrane recepter protein